jgi:acyl-CoA synthetase (NDP forming)
VVEDALARFGPNGGWLEPGEVEAIFGCFGIQVPASTTVHDEEAAVQAARGIGGPVAVKVLSASALHKSDVGGVLLGLEGDEGVREAYRRVTAAVPDPTGVLIQEMVAGGHEVLIGMSEDPSFGPLIVFGLGGVLVELMGDVTFRIHPLTDVDARIMRRSIKGSRLLEGYRNLPAGDVASVEEMLLRVSAMITVLPEIREMDLNPVKVLEPGNGARVVDARIRVAPVTAAAAPELVDLPSVTGHRVG